MFKKYASIENSYREEFLNRIRDHGFWNKEYVIQEKAHGANLSYWTNDGDHFYSGKRTSQLESNERFYNFQEVLKSIKSKLKAIWIDLREINPAINQITFFGELIGGNYPHNEVSKNKNAIKVQKGIFYGPDNYFYAFDILINREEYLNVNLATELFEKYDLLHAKTIFRGDIGKCLNYSNDFNSMIPEQLKLPKIEPNICEGTIIKSVENLKFNNGVRVILKNKNDKWSEKIRISKIKEVVEPSEKVVQLQEKILLYVTENRLNNVISKIGEVTKNDFGKVLGLFNKDIFEDFLRDYKDEFYELEKKEMKLVTKSINKYSVKMIKKSAPNIG